MKRPTVGSVFSGIGGFDLGLERAGWQVRWQVEKDPYRQNILRRHWPDMELRTDVTTDTDGLERTDLVCGGFPCTDLSVAGKRAGLDGTQSSLWYEFARVIEDTRPTWVLVENVPGLFSSHQGKDFAIVVNGLAERGFGVAWRVLDSRYFGVAQRRRRVFIVGRAGRQCPLEVLFEPESGSRDTQARGEERIHVARTLDGGLGRGYSGHQIESQVVPTLNTSTGTGLQQPDFEGYVVNGRQDPIAGLQPLDGAGHSLAVVTRDTAHPLRANRWGGSDSHGDEGNIVAHTLRASNGPKGWSDRGDGSNNIVVSQAADADRVRETPGVPGGLDATPDGPRYAALGDAVTVPVIEWIGRRMLAVHRRTT